jgi:hypothetical protein
MKGIKEIGSFFSSVHGIIICLIAVVTLATSLLLRHDARIIQKYNDNNKQANQELKINQLIKSDSIRNIEEPMFKQTVLDSLRIVSRNQRQLKTSYINWVQNHSNSVKEFVDAMNGLEFTVVQPTVNKSIEEVKPEMKIRIEKIKK